MTEIPEFTTRPELAGTFGMVASTHWLASAAGMAVLEKGGNAFDAAVAAGFTLQVVEPHLNGPGGEVPVIGHDARRGETFVVCGQGTAPAAATVEAYTGLGLDLVPGSGLLAATVPGAFGGWLLLLREYGTLRLRDVLGYAIGYAASGYPLVPAISWSIASVADLFREHWHTSAEVYLPGRRRARAGLACSRTARSPPPTSASSPRRKRRATTATPSSRPPARAWYDGFVAEEIAKFATTAVMDVTGERHRGLLTGHDLATWHARLEAPATYEYHGPDGLQDRPLGPGAGLPAAARAAARLRPGGHGAGQRRVHPPRDRGGQARLRRPGGVVRRPRVHRRARSTTCCRSPTTTSGASSSATPRAWSCARAAPAGGNLSCRDSPRTRSGATGL